jgi:hypothetical protein
MPSLPPEARDLLRAETGREDDPLLCLRSDTHVDAGSWLTKTPVWLCITEDRVAVVVAGRRHHVASVRRAECKASRYDHATGEVVIEPGEALRFDRLAFQPREALRILHLLGAET